MLQARQEAPFWLKVNGLWTYDLDISSATSSPTSSARPSASLVGNIGSTAHRISTTPRWAMLVAALCWLFLPLM
ncbi:hypothetical protein BT69DRAFT_1012960 [Atractiella rhizophila]|nr:hypothetical protein BT69DRAFT_1012960 [Atractiella rhizophila]